MRFWVWSAFGVCKRSGKRCNERNSSNAQIIITYETTTTTKIQIGTKAFERDNVTIHTERENECATHFGDWCVHKKSTHAFAIWFVSHEWSEIRGASMLRRCCGVFAIGRHRSIWKCYLCRRLTIVCDVWIVLLVWVYNVQIYIVYCIKYMNWWEALMAEYPPKRHTHVQWIKPTCCAPFCDQKRNSHSPLCVLASCMSYRVIYYSMSSSSSVRDARPALCCLFKRDK